MNIQRGEERKKWNEKRTKFLQTPLTYEIFIYIHSTATDRE